MSARLDTPSGRAARPWPRDLKMGVAFISVGVTSLAVGGGLLGHAMETPRPVEDGLDVTFFAPGVILLGIGIPFTIVGTILTGVGAWQRATQTKPATSIRLKGKRRNGLS